MLKRKRDADQADDGSSSEADDSNPYTDLVSLVAVRKVESNSDSDEPEEKKMKSQAGVAKGESDDSEGSTSGDDDEDADSDCLAEERESDQDDKESAGAENVQMIIFGESDEESSNQLDYTKTDFFKHHFEHNFTENIGDVEKLRPQILDSMQWPILEQIRHVSRSEKMDVPSKPLSKKMSTEALRNVHHVRKVLVDNWIQTNNLKECQKELFTPLQRELFTLFHSYGDVSYSHSEALTNSLDIQKAYCLHAANHVLRSRAKVLLNTARLKQMTPEQREQADYRDQGITRPKVLIMLPFKDAALKVVDILLGLFKRGKKFEIGYRKRFYDEFNKEEDDCRDEEALGKKPEDYQQLFSGNIDEHFRIGIALLRNSVRLYAPFYSSDIIIASPLGLRTIIGAKEEAHYEHDFLSSIEMLIMDRADLFLMQNWEHVLHIFQHLNLTPKDSHGADFSRVRNFSLDGLNKFFRQTISISSVALPQISSLFTKSCWNYKGCFVVEGVSDTGSICAIAKQLPQVYHKLMPATMVESAEVRFRFFIDRIFKQYKDMKMSRTVVYIPQYFDFVRIRNYMRKEWKSGAGPIFAHINDYSTASEAGKAKRRFFTGKCPIMLYTERFHFYNRTRIRGMRNLVFYELPTYPHFYAELCNMIRETDDSNAGGTSGSVIVMYTKYDTRKLAATVGLSRCRELQATNKNVHMFVTGS